MGRLETLPTGTRVQLREPSYTLKAQSLMGTIVRPDRWLDYYIVRLDQPAYYLHADGREEELSEIREDIDNLEVLSPGPAPANSNQSFSPA